MTKYSHVLLPKIPKPLKVSVRTVLNFVFHIRVIDVFYLFFFFCFLKLFVSLGSNVRFEQGVIYCLGEIKIYFTRKANDVKMNTFIKVKGQSVAVEM